MMQLGSVLCHPQSETVSYSPWLLTLYQWIISSLFGKGGYQTFLDPAFSLPKAMGTSGHRQWNTGFGDTQLLHLRNETFNKNELRLMFIRVFPSSFLERSTNLPSLAAVAVVSVVAVWNGLSVQRLAALGTRETYCWSKRGALCKLAHLLQVKNRSFRFL